MFSMHINAKILFGPDGPKRILRYVVIELVRPPNGFFKCDPDIGFVWDFISFYVSLGVIDHKKSNLPLPSVGEFLL